MNWLVIQRTCYINFYNYAKRLSEHLEQKKKVLTAKRSLDRYNFLILHCEYNFMKLTPLQSL